MNKELKALEDLFYIANKFNDTCPIDKLKQTHRVDLDNDYRIIKNALERLEQLEEEKQSFDRQLEKKLKALEIIKETPEFAWYVKIYNDAYEMISDVKGFRVNNSVEELQKMFDLLKEVLL